MEVERPHRYFIVCDVVIQQQDPATGAVRQVQSKINLEAALEQPITGAADITGLQQRLCHEHKYAWCLVVAFQRFEEPGSKLVIARPGLANGMRVS